MEQAQQFHFAPLSVTNNNTVASPPVNPPDGLGALADLIGTWEGPGFNQIWRPFHDPIPDPSLRFKRDSFLELNSTQETLTFTAIKGPIPNRGLLQPDIAMFGVHYLQGIIDVNTGKDIHFENGIWLNVPATTDPEVPPTVVRMASIPHGTTILAQGVVHDSVLPDIKPLSIIPHRIKPLEGEVPAPFVDQFRLLTPNAFRSPDDQLVGIDQDMVTNPNIVLSRFISNQEITHTRTLDISSNKQEPAPGGDTANTAFLQGATSDPARPNADAAQVDALFWIETVKGGNGEEDFLQLQYTQKVILNFAGLSWPHVSVATLRKVT